MILNESNAAQSSLIDVQDNAISAHSSLSSGQVRTRINRGRLSEQQIRHLLLRRYGSTFDFSQIQQSYASISKSTHVPIPTIVQAIRRFHANGNFFVERVPRRWMNLPPEVERKICSHEYLNEWRCLPLKRRVFLIKEQFDVTLSITSLSKIYKKNGVRFTKAHKATRLSKKKEAQVNKERIEFAHKLLDLPFFQLVYADETTFDVWTPPSRVWQSAECQVVIPLNSKHLQNLTVYGAIGACLSHPVYYVANSTNQTDFVHFVGMVRAAVLPHLAQEQIHLVLDNHRAHHTNAAMEAMRENRIVAQFQPPYSSQFNCQESVWSILKRNFYARLYRLDYNMTRQSQFEEMLKEVLRDVPFCQHNLMRANKRFVQAYADMRPYDEDSIDYESEAPDQFD